MCTESKACFICFTLIVLFCVGKVAFHPHPQSGTGNASAATDGPSTLSKFDQMSTNINGGTKDADKG